jgi:hypothetical protein
MKDDILRRTTAWVEKFMHYSSPSYKKWLAKELADNVKATEKLREQLYESD